jgi:hypothetical protein
MGRDATKAVLSRQDRLARVEIAGWLKWRRRGILLAAIVNRAARQAIPNPAGHEARSVRLFGEKWWRRRRKCAQDEHSVEGETEGLTNIAGFRHQVDERRVKITPCYTGEGRDVKLRPVSSLESL